MSDLLASTAIETVVRASSLPQYPDCPRRWAARHLRREIEPLGFRLREITPHIGAATGSATHEAMGFMLDSKMRTGELGNATEAEQRALERLKKEIEPGATWDDTTPDMNTGQKQVLRQQRAYRLHVASKIEPIAVERRLNARHAATGITVSGQQDTVVAKPDTLRDLKTGTRRGANHAQYGSYSRLLRSHGRPVQRIVEDYVKRAPLAHEQPAPVEIHYDMRACEAATEAVLRRVSVDMDAFRQSGSPEAFLANPSSTLCSPKFCPAFGSDWCAYGRERETR